MLEISGKASEPRARDGVTVGVGDLVVSTPDSFLGSGELILVTNSLPASELFFYGVVCGDGSDSEEHLWSTENFEVVSKVRRSQKNSIKNSGCL